MNKNKTKPHRHTIQQPSKQQKTEDVYNNTHTRANKRTKQQIINKETTSHKHTEIQQFNKNKTHKTKQKHTHPNKKQRNKPHVCTQQQTTNTTQSKNAKRGTKTTLNHTDTQAIQQTSKQHEIENVYKNTRANKHA